MRNEDTTTTTGAAAALPGPVPAPSILPGLRLCCPSFYLLPVPGHQWKREGVWWKRRHGESSLLSPSDPDSLLGSHCVIIEGGLSAPGHELT